MSPFISNRNARRLAMKHVADQAKAINDALCGGKWLININVGVVDALAKLIQQAGGWSATVKIRGEEQGAVLVRPDPSVARNEVAKSPIYSYDECRRRSVEYVARAAIEINDLLGQGVRLVPVPIGLADDIVAGLNAEIDGEPSGWRVSVKSRTDSDAFLFIEDDERVDAQDDVPEIPEARA